MSGYYSSLKIQNYSSQITNHNKQITNYLEIRLIRLI